jgi:hypothetical protein
MKIRKIKNSNDAIVGIVTAFLITGLIVVVISVIQTVYVPKWMEQSEAEHMETVADQFSQLKFAIDTQSALKNPDTPISTSITLGNKEVPFLTSSRAYGSLDIMSDEYMVTITTSDSGDSSYHAGVIKYSSVNSYFLNQDYVYESGAIIISQSEGDIMSIKPAFSAKNGEDIHINFTIVNISTIGDKRSISGYGTYPIQTEYPNPNFEPTVEPFDNNVLEITINTSYANSWHRFINKTLVNSGLKYGTDFSIGPNDNDDGISILFLDRPASLDLKVIKIAAQISPGWIENVKGI